MNQKNLYKSNVFLLHGGLWFGQVEWYNSLFDAHQLDFILLPAAHNATPDLAQALSATIPAIDEKGEATTSVIYGNLYIP